LNRALLDRYRIDRTLGRGGMGLVLLAQDLRLQRPVAIKLLPPELASDAELVGRFEREARTAAQLDHPNIIPIFAVESTQDLHYFVMKYVDGPSLESLLEGGPLPTERTERVVWEAAVALGHAHARGVVHRDVKPANIMLDRDGRVQIADFGISRAMGGTHVTRTGQLVGTPYYMSPEQAKGTTVDGRSDQYSLAIVGYELLAGQPPFSGESLHTVLYKHISEPPPPLERLRPDAPPFLVAALHRALAKEPAERFATMEEFAAAVSPERARDNPRPSGIPAPPRVTSDTPTEITDPAMRRGRRPLRRLWVGAAAVVGLGVIGALLAGVLHPRDVSVAVMPFDNFSGDSNYDHLAEDMTDEIITHLAQIAKLRVISRNSVFALRGVKLTTPEIGSRLGVRYVIEGSLRLQGPEMRVDAELVNADRDASLWAQSYQHDVRDAFRAQEDVARLVTTAFVQTVRVPGGAGDTHAVAHHESFGAGRRAYVAGERALAHRAPADVRSALARFEEALAQDSADAAAWAGLASAYAVALTYRYRVPVADLQAARAALGAAHRALALDSGLAAAHVARGVLESVVGAPAGAALADFDHALRLKPSAADARAGRARLLAGAGRGPAALDDARRAVTLDPLSPGPRLARAEAALAARAYDTAAAEAEQALRLAPALALARATEARAWALAGAGARCATMDLGPYAGTRALCLAAAGQGTAGAVVVDSLVRALASGGSDTLYTDVVRAEDVALYYAWLGDAVRSRAWLTRALALSPAGADPELLATALFARVRTPAFDAFLEHGWAAAWTRVHEVIHVAASR
jgi:serine/threonine-protein kinase